MSAPILFDAVIFDLDGTLVATEAFWVAAAAAGAERALAELGIERALPSRGEWLSMVGLPLERAFAIVFPDLPEMQRRVVMARCVEAEEAALRGRVRNGADTRGRLFGWVQPREVLTARERREVRRLQRGALRLRTS